MSENYYLSSMESTFFEPVRSLAVIDRLMLKSGQMALLVELEEALPGNALGSRSDVDQLVLVSRHEGEELPPEGKLPCFVHICIFRDGHIPAGRATSSEDLIDLAWGEIYSTYDEALNHKFS